MDMEYDRKVQDMQKYIPFLVNLIRKLESSKDDKPRKAQLSKMQMLHGLLTNKEKKLKIDTLLKCESVLIKLYKKVEKVSTLSAILLDSLLLPEDPTFYRKKTSEDTLPPPPPPPPTSKPPSKPPPPPPSKPPPPPPSKPPITSKDIIIEPPASPISDDEFEFQEPIEIPTERRYSPTCPTGFSDSPRSSSYERDRERNRLSRDYDRDKDWTRDRERDWSRDRDRIWERDSERDRFWDREYERDRGREFDRDRQSYERGRDRPGCAYNDGRTDLFRRRTPPRYDTPRPYVTSTNRYEEHERQRELPMAYRTLDNNDYISKRSPTMPLPSATSLLQQINRYDRFYEIPKDEMFESPASPISESAFNTDSPFSPCYNTSSHSRDNDNGKSVFSRLGHKLDINNSNTYENFKVNVVNSGKSRKIKSPTPLTDVLNSPPLTLDDIDDLLNESLNEAKNKSKKNDTAAIKKSHKNDLDIIQNKLAKDINFSKAADDILANASKILEGRDHLKRKESHDVLRRDPRDISPRTDSPRDVYSSTTTNRRELCPRSADPKEMQRTDHKDLTRMHEPTKDINSIDLNRIDLRETIHNDLANEKNTLLSDQDPNFRLAYKYNPHRRKSISIDRIEDYEPTPAISNLKPNDPRVNKPITLPVINLSDPRLRNRPMSTFIPPPLPAEVLHKQPAMPSNIAMSTNIAMQPNISMPQNICMSPNTAMMANAAMLPNTNMLSNTAMLPNTAMQPNKIPSLLDLPIPSIPPTSSPTFGNYPVQMQPPSDVDINNYKRFHPLMNDQVERIKYLESKKSRPEPRTYGEYRQARLAEQKNHNKKPKQKSNGNKASSSTTPAAAAAATATPNTATSNTTIDQMYRNNDFSQDVGTPTNFKIPKVAKKTTETAEKQKEEEPTTDVSKSVSKSDSQTPEDEKISNKKLDPKKDKKSSKLTKDEDTAEKTKDPSDDTTSKPVSTKKKKKDSEKETKQKDEDNKDVKGTANEVADDDDDDDEDVVVVVTRETEKEEEEEPEEINIKTTRLTRSKTRAISIDVSPSQSDETVTENIEKSPSIQKEQQSKKPINKKKKINVIDDDSDVEIIENTENKEIVTEKTVKDDSEDCVVTSTTANIVQTDVKEDKPSTSSSDMPAKEEHKNGEITKEWLEGFLINIFNPNVMNTTGVLGMLEKVLDDDKFKQIKTIIEDEKQDTLLKKKVSDSQEIDVKDVIKKDDISEKETKENVPALSSSTSLEDNDVPMKTESKEVKEDVPPAATIAAPKKKKGELDRLNEDIRDMFISEGVLTATGRRMCTIMNEKKVDDEKKTKEEKQKSAAIKQTAKDNNTKIESRQTRAKSDPVSIESPFVKPKPPPQNKKKEPATSAVAATNKKKRGKAEKPKLSTRTTRSKLAVRTSTPTMTTDDDTSDGDNENELLDIETEDGHHESNEEELNNKKEEIESTKYKPCPKSRKRKTVKNSLKPKEDSLSTSDKFDESDQSECPLVIDESFENSCDESHDATSNTAASIQGDDISESSDLSSSMNNLKKLPDQPKTSRPPRLEKEIDDTITTDHFKNVDIEMHSMGAYKNICRLCKFQGRYLTSHYATAHPTGEILISRLTTETIKRLKENQSTVQNVKNKKKVYHLSCPFCNLSLSNPSQQWMLHFTTHTGEYLYKCSNCYHYDNKRSKMVEHIREHCPTGEVLSLRSPIGEGKSIMGHVCNICNYIQMERDNVVKHLRTQHDYTQNYDENITEITLLSCKNKSVVVELDVLENDNTVINNSKKSSLSSSSSSDEPANKKVLQSEPQAIENTLEVFMPRKPDDLHLDKNFMKFMSEISFSSDKITEERPQTRSIADRISERFKIVKANEEKNSPEKQNNDNDPKPSTSSASIADKTNNSNSLRSPSPPATTTTTTTPTPTTPSSSQQQRISERLSNRFEMLKNTSQIEDINSGLTKSMVDDNTNDKPSENDVTNPDNEMITNSNTSSPNKITKNSSNSSSDNCEILFEINTSNTNARNNEQNEMSIDLTDEPPPPPPETNTENDQSHQDNVSQTDKNDPEKNIALPSTSSKNTENSNELVNTVDDDDNDDDWEDIETLPSPSTFPVENDDLTRPSTSTSIPSNAKSKKNRAIYETLSRLYASIVPRNKVNSSKKDKKSLNDSRSSSRSSNHTEKDKVTQKPRKEIPNQETSVGGDKDKTSIELPRNESLEQASEQLSTLPSSASISERRTSLTSVPSSIPSPTPSMDEDNLIDRNDLILDDPLIDENTQLFDEPDMDLIPMSTEQLSEIELDPLDTGITSDSLQLSDHVDLDDAIAVLLDNNIDNLIINNDIINASDDNDLQTTNKNGSITNTSNILQSANGSSSSSSNPFNLNLDDNNLDINNTTSTAPTSPPIINRIDKLGYSQRNDVFKYYCLVEACTFLYSDLSVGLKSHFIQEHEQIDWEGYCHTCVSQVSCNENLTLDNELQHMMDCHVRSKVIRLPETQNTGKTDNIVKPMIKFRRLSGDILSSIGKNAAGEKSDTPTTTTTIPREEPKIHNKIQLPEAKLPNLQVTTTSKTFKQMKITPKPNSSSSDTTATPTTGDNQTMLSTYLIRNNITPLKVTGIALKDGKKILHKQSKPITPSTSPLPIQQQQQQQTSPPPPIIISKVEGAVPQTKKSELKITKVVGGISSGTSSPSLSSAAAVATQKSKKSTESTNTSGLKISSVASININIKFCLKPWTTTKSKKSPATSLKLLRDICLFSLYKCMGEECTFTTNNADIMTEHLKNHLSHAVKSRGLFYGYSPFLECAYCSVTSTTIDQLINHITNTHSQDIYQCPYCFYRACSDYYIITHLVQFHPSDEKFVFVCFGDKTEPNLIAISDMRRQFVKPIGCFDCTDTFYIVRNFVNHIKTAHQRGLSFTCAICRNQIHKNNSAKHFAQAHNIDVLQCIYCIFGGSTMGDMRRHMANMHPSCLPYVALREPKEENLLIENESLDTGTQLACIADPVDPKLFHKCPYFPFQLNLMSPVLNDTTHKNSDPFKSLNNTSDQVEPIVVQKSTDLEITHVQSQSNEVFAKGSSPAVTGSTENLQQETSTVASINELNLIDRIVPISNVSSVLGTNTHNPSSTLVLSPVKQSTGNLNTVEKSSSLVGKLTTKPTTPTPVQTTASSSSSSSSMITPPPNVNEKSLTGKQMYSKIELAANEIVAGTGLDGCELYRCGYPECSEQSPDINKFHAHLVCHPIDGTTNKVSCYHCKNNFKNLCSLKSHMKTHSIHRYFCFWCMLNGSTVNALIRHISDAHLKNNVITIPLIPGKIDKYSHYFVVGPKTLKPDDISGFGERLLKLSERKKSLTKTHYTPDEIDLLPRQAIFLKELYCSVCQYRTKVRTNMFRHLQFHREAINVASVDPVNPVPCLNTNEKHFDKMVNLACSSYTGKDFKTQDAKLPDYISELKRFVCGVPNCTYLTINEAMIKSHLNTLHSNDKIFTCPHCNFDVCKMRVCPFKVVQHLKYHNSKLYECGSCNYLHYQRHVVVRHIFENHQKQQVQLAMYERGEGTVNKVITPINENLSDNIDGRSTTNDGDYNSLLGGSGGIGGKTVSPKKSSSKKRAKNKKIWECSICRHRTNNSSQILAHMLQIHQSKDKYQCSNCNYSSTNITDIAEHADVRHPSKVTDARLLYYEVQEPAHKEIIDTTPLWRRDPNKIKSIRGILMEEEEHEPPSLSSLNDNAEESFIDNDLLVINDDDSSSNEQQPSSSSSSVILDIGSGNSVDKEITAESRICHKCTFLARTQSELVDHLHTEHNQKITVDLILPKKKSSSDDIPKPEQTLEQFNKYIKYICYYCPDTNFSDMKMLSDHYDSKHKEQQATTPFRFKINKIYKCHLCPYKDTYKKIEIHYNLIHTGLPVVTRDAFILFKCGLCSYRFSGNPAKQVEHYLAVHPETQHLQNEPYDTTSKDNKDEPKNYMSDEFLNDLLHHTDGFGKEIFCEECLTIHDDMKSFSGHHKSVHGHKKKSWSTPCIRYACPVCPSSKQLFTNTDNILKHVRYEHAVNYACKECRGIFQKESDFYTIPHLTSHPIGSSSSPIVYIVEKKDIKTKLDNNIELIFPNGFTMKKADGKFTKYYNWGTNFLHKTDADKRKHIIESFKKHNLSDDNSNTTITRRDSECSSVSSSSTITSNSRKSSSGNKGTYKSVIASSPSSSFNKKDTTNIQTFVRDGNDNDDDEPLKKKFKINTSDDDDDNKKIEEILEPYSYYGMEREVIDLSKINTKITVLGYDINIPCDRYIKSFKLKAVVKCEKINIDNYVNTNNKKRKLSTSSSASLSSLTPTKKKKSININ